MRSIGLPELLVIFGLLLYVGPLLLLVPYWKIFSRAGFPGWMSLLTLVPVVGLVTLYVIAFSEWPAMPRPAAHQPQNP